MLDIALVETVCERCRRRLIDDAQDVETGDLAGFLRRLTLGIREIGRDGDDGVADGFTEVGLSIALELAKGAGTDLLRCVGLAVNVDGPTRAHVTLHRTDGAVDIGDGLALGDLANEHLAVLCEGDDRGGGPGAFCIRDDDGFAAFEDRDDRVGRAQINTHCSGHGGDAPSFGVTPKWTLVHL